MGESKLPDLIAGRYRPIGEIGRGGMGSVYLVEHINTGDRLALKMLHTSFGGDPGLVERFKREARAAAKIKSDHVVRITDADVAPELGGMPFMVMEVLNGEDVRKRLGARGAFPREEAVNILSQVARALDRAHAMGIVHRDIKPENIFMHLKEDGSEIVKLLDFGISKMTGEGEEHATQAGTLLGTPTFMAPEQVRTGPISPQTDMWAIGMVAHRLLVGRNYWPKASTGELMALILVRPMELPSTHPGAEHLGGAYDAWFMRSCDRDPTKRWASVAEQVSALSDALRLARPPATLQYAVPPPQTSTAVIAPNPMHSSTPSIGTGASAVTNGAVTTGATATPAKSSSTIAILIAGAMLFTIVAYGAARLMSARVAAKTNAATSTASAMTAPLVTATIPASVAQPAVDPSIALPQPTAISSVLLATSASASVATAPTTAPTSTHARSQSTAEKKPVPATHNTAEDPWAR